MIITCPNCQTRYQVTQQAIGSAGRKVQCAHCQQSWKAIAEEEVLAKPQAKPKPEEKTSASKPDNPDDKLFDADTEAELDQAFEREQKAASPEQDTASEQENAGLDDEDFSTKNDLDPALQNKRHKAMLRRQMDLAKKFPLNRVRRTARLVGALLLSVIIVGGVYFRTEIVRVIPDLAGVYSSIGLGVNIVGLEFTEVQTLRALKDGTDVMMVSARIRNVGGGQVPVPGVVVSILDESGNSLLNWSVTPLARSIGPGEVVDFETELNSAPQGAETVKLAFANGRTN